MRGPTVLLALALAWRCAAASQVPCADTTRCLNGGTCYVDSRVGTYCACAPGFVGTLCELSSGAVPTTCTAPAGVSSLLVSYCVNGGVCPTDAGSFCDCSTVPTDGGGNTFRHVATRARSVHTASNPGLLTRRAHAPQRRTLRVPRPEMS